MLEEHLLSLKLLRDCGIPLSHASLPGGVKSYIKNLLSDGEIDPALKSKLQNIVAKEFDSNALDDLIKAITTRLVSLDAPPKFNQAANEEALLQPVSKLKLVGPSKATHLKKLGIETIGDLLFHFPYRYIDLSKIRSIREARTGENATLVGTVTQIKQWRGRKGTLVINVVINDGTGSITGTWFNQRFIANRFKEGMQVAFSGKVDYKMQQKQIANPMYDIITEDGQETIHSGRIVPVHPATENLSAMMIRKIMKLAVDEYSNVPDPIPAEILEQNELISRSLAIKEIHFPSSREMLRQSRTRLIFEELFFMQVGLASRKKRLEMTAKGINHHKDGDLIQKFYNLLPFTLTADQQTAILEIQEDMIQAKPMNRLLQGEVGSGKTMVALTAMLTSIQSGYQAAMMAPTEVLANQHYSKLKPLLDQLGVTSALITGSVPAKERERINSTVTCGDIDIVIGTHAIIQDSVDFKTLGIAVIDEQHRFGVEQRITLKEKGYHPDILVMSATPIPRTLSLTLYGDLDISIIKELPGGKKIGENIKTVLCDDQNRDWAYEKIREEISAGHQAYIVCPLIEESDRLEVKSVMEEIDRLQNEIFPQYRVGFIHGKLKSSEKDEVMKKFVEGELDILLSTTVIEVGIDVHNATVMLIENADRFGLAQLHQLRGRVGRGKALSHCILFATPTTDESKQRMDAICSINDGFELAEADLHIRGQGQLFGIRQSGLPDLKLAKLARDIDILAKARKQAFKIVDEDPYLTSPVYRPLVRHVRQKFGSNVDWLFQV